MRKDISDRIAELLQPGDYKVTESDTIPGPGDTRVTFGETAVRFQATALFIDMRGSTGILNRHRAHNVAKVHKAFLYTATTLLANRGGQIRSYNGDSILAFFQGPPGASVPVAVRTAMEIKFILGVECAAEFKRYSDVDFGIGLDHGGILCVKAGRGRNSNHNDLLWLGNAVNRSVRLGDKAASRAHVWISERCYESLDNDTKTSKGVSMWQPQTLEYNGTDETAYSSTYHWKVA